MGSLSQPPFARVAIVGFGLIGGSIALAVKRRWPSVVVTAIDRPHVVDAALRLRAADEGGDHLSAAGGADLVMLAAPVLQNVAALTALPDHLDCGLITDAGSTKRVMADAAAALPEGLEFIGGHPLAGAAVSGVEAARPDLFDDRPWILTTTPRSSEAALSRLTQFVTGLHAVPQLMDGAEHDRLLAYLSHLPQLAVTALMHVVGDHAGEQGLALAGRGLRDTTRLASSPPNAWRDIVASNGDNITSALDDLIAALRQLRASASLAGIGTGAAPGNGETAPPQISHVTVTQLRAEASTHASPAVVTSAAAGNPRDAALGALEAMFLSAARWKGVLEHS